MRALLFLLSLCLVALLVTSAEARPSRHQRPGVLELVSRIARSPQDIKGKPSYTKGGATKPRVPPALNLRKGEYICGNKVCKLRPGEIPAGCNGICQYPV